VVAGAADFACNQSKGRCRSDPSSRPLIPHAVACEYLGGHRLRLRFDDGAEGEVDLAQQLRWEAIFAPLRDPLSFARVQVVPDAGTIEWPNGADVDPVVLRHWATGEALPDWAEPLEDEGG